MNAFKAKRNTTRRKVKCFFVSYLLSRLHVMMMMHLKEVQQRWCLTDGYAFFE
jgi:hypothetical protein